MYFLEIVVAVINTVDRTSRFLVVFRRYCTSARITQTKNYTYYPHLAANCFMLDNTARPQHLHVRISHVSKHAEENHKTKHGYVFWAPTKREEGTTMMNNKSTGLSLKPPKTPKPCVLTNDGHSTATPQSILQLTVENTTSPPLRSTHAAEMNTAVGSARDIDNGAQYHRQNINSRPKTKTQHKTHRGLENGSLQTHTHTRMEISHATGS
ncbi:unnamed protein product, partial [Ectocarpus sp. 12 AP-2014]